MDHLFTDAAVDLTTLRARAYNLRWASVAPGVIPLTAADPDFPVAPAITAALKRYLDPGVLSYGPPEGLPGFRASVSDWLATRGVRRGPECVLATNSAASAMFLAAQYALQPGDEAIVFDPVDFLFGASVEAAGGRVVRCPLDAEGRFDPDALRALVTSRTRLVCVCNPHNPLGRVLRERELAVIGELAVERRLWVMSDEIWSDIVYAPRRHVSTAAISPEVAARTLTVNGFSKTFGLAGLRVGALTAPNARVAAELLERSLAPTTANGVSTLSQVAARAALEEGRPWADAFLRHLRRMRDLAVGRLDAMPGVSCRAPEGTYVVFPDVSALGLDAEVLAERLLERARVAVVPGAPRWFGPGARGHLRLCFATSEGILTEALDRIAAAIDEVG